MAKRTSLRRAYSCSMEVSALRERRYQMGLTQKQLAKRMGFSWTEIAKMETGVRKPSAFFLQCWREALGVEC